jgi:hypothetical protein
MDLGVMFDIPRRGVPHRGIVLWLSPSRGNLQGVTHLGYRKSVKKPGYCEKPGFSLTPVKYGKAMQDPGRVGRGLGAYH